LLCQEHLKVLNLDLASGFVSTFLFRSKEKILIPTRLSPHPGGTLRYDFQFVDLVLITKQVMSAPFKGDGVATRAGRSSWCLDGHVADKFACACRKGYRSTLVLSIGRQHGAATSKQ